MIQLSTNQSINVANLCAVNYGSHIGEYIKYKLDELGMKHAHLAKNITENGREMSRSNLSRILVNKAEFTPSEMQMFSEALPEGFFDEFYHQNPKLKPYQTTREVAKPAEENEPAYQVGGSGYRISIEIDPVDFDPTLMDPLSASLKKALEDFHNSIKDKKRTK